MTATIENPFVDLATIAVRSQAVFTDSVETWLGIAAAVGEASGSQAKNLRQILHGLFDLVDQGFAVEREVATYLTIASRVSATAADSCRELTDLTLATIEAAIAAAGRSR